MASPNPASPELEETAKGVESTPPVGSPSSTAAINRLIDLSAKKVSLAELLKRIDEFDEDAVAPVMATGPPSVAPPSILSQPGGPVGRLVPKSIKDFFAPIKSTPAAKAKESKLVELRDPIQIDSESDSSEDVTTLFATPAPSKKTETKAAPEEVGEPLILQEDPLVQVPASVNSKLRDYQREGVKVSTHSGALANMRFSSCGVSSRRNAVEFLVMTWVWARPFRLSRSSPLFYLPHSERAAF